jgi:hypothetical protein
LSRIIYRSQAHIVIQEGRYDFSKFEFVQLNFADIIIKHNC